MPHCGYPSILPLQERVPGEERRRTVQDELTNSEVRSDKRLVLGFDAGCFTCSGLAARIEERVGDKLAVRNLNDSEVQRWRKQALGEDAKWAPTLFEIEDGKVKAWAGWRMGWALSRSIGTAATWKVMQALGEIGVAPKIEESTIVDKLPERAVEAVVGLSRGQFLKSVGGAAVAASVLSGAGTLTSPAQAATRSPYDIVKTKKITGASLTKAARQSAANRDVKNVAGTALDTVAKIKATDPSVFLHTLRNGTTVRAVSYRISGSRRLIHFAFSARPIRGARSLARIWQTDGRRWVTVKASEGGKLWRKPGDRTRVEGEGIVPLGECPPVGGGGTVGIGACWTRSYECVDFEVTSECVESAGNAGFACAACALSFIATLETVGATVAAISIACGACEWTAGWAQSHCCVRRGYVCRYICGTT